MPVTIPYLNIPSYQNMITKRNILVGKQSKIVISYKIRAYNNPAFLFYTNCPPYLWKKSPRILAKPLLPRKLFVN